MAFFVSVFISLIIFIRLQNVNVIDNIIISIKQQTILNEEH